jgi:hypothetical protein
LTWINLPKDVDMMTVGCGVFLYFSCVVASSDAVFFTVFEGKPFSILEF